MQALVDGAERQLEFPRNSRPKSHQGKHALVVYDACQAALVSRSTNRSRPTFKGRKRELHVTAGRVKMRKSKRKPGKCADVAVDVNLAAVHAARLYQKRQAEL